MLPLPSIQSKTNGLTSSGTSRQCSLPLRHYCIMLLLVLLAFNGPSSNNLAKRLTDLVVKSTELSLESANRLKQSCMLSQSALRARVLCSSQKCFLTVW